MSSDALRGASLAFSQNKRKDEPHIANVADKNKEWADHGARFAASSTAARSRDQSQTGYPHTHYHGGNGPTPGHFSAQTTGSSVLHDAGGLLPPASRPGFDSKSPSLIAATLAASRSASPSPGFNIGLPVSPQGQAVDATSVASTRNLISTFEGGVGGEQRKRRSPPRHQTREQWMRRENSNSSARTDETDEILLPKPLPGLANREIHPKRFVEEVKKGATRAAKWSSSEEEEMEEDGEATNTLSRASTIKATPRYRWPPQDSEGIENDQDDEMEHLSRVSTLRAKQWPLQEQPVTVSMQDLVNEAVMAAKAPKPKQAPVEKPVPRQASKPDIDIQQLRATSTLRAAESPGGVDQPPLKSKRSLKTVPPEAPAKENAPAKSNVAVKQVMQQAVSPVPAMRAPKNPVTPVKRVEEPKIPASPKEVSGGQSGSAPNKTPKPKPKPKMSTPTLVIRSSTPEIVSPRPKRPVKPALEAATSPRINLQAPKSVSSVPTTEPEKKKTPKKLAQNPPTPPQPRSLTKGTPKVIIQPTPPKRLTTRRASNASSEDSFVSASSVQSPERFPSPPSPPLPGRKMSLVSAPGSPSRTPSLRPRHRSSTSASTSALVLNDLTNAIVAGSLAARLTPHNTGSQLPLPTLPPRIKSPRLRQTLRNHEEPLETETERHKKSHLRRLNKGKHSHHEGSRKKWREKITSRERKRYEALWQSNRGNFVENHPDSLAKDTSEYVSNIVVRQVWKRSRLPFDELSEVWDLVDREKKGVLHKVEFVVGLWLIDQRLKGRKIPQKVGESVWASANGMMMTTKVKR